MQVSESIKKIRGYDKKVRRSTNESLKQNKEVAAKWNIEQMELGKKADGSLQPGYSPATEGYERTTPISAGEPIKLKDTGDYHEGMYRGTTVKDNIMELKSANWKNEMLEIDYDPLGLTSEKLHKLTIIIFNDLVTDLRAYFR